MARNNGGTVVRQGRAGGQVGRDGPFGLHRDGLGPGVSEQRTNVREGAEGCQSQAGRARVQCCGLVP